MDTVQTFMPPCNESWEYLLCFVTLHVIGIEEEDSGTVSDPLHTSNANVFRAFHNLTF